MTAIRFFIAKGDSGNREYVKGITGGALVTTTRAEAATFTSARHGWQRANVFHALIQSQLLNVSPLGGGVVLQLEVSDDGEDSSDPLPVALGSGPALASHK